MIILLLNIKNQLLRKLDVRSIKTLRKAERKSRENAAYKSGFKAEFA